MLAAPGCLRLQNLGSHSLIQSLAIFLGSCYDDASGRVLQRSSSAAGKAAAVTARWPLGHTGGSLPRWTGSSGKTGSSHLEDEWDADGLGLQEMVQPLETARERVRDERKRAWGS